MSAPLFELRGVGFDHGPVRVLDGLDLEVGVGELVVCVGPSGCGKSTLLALLGGHLAPSRGELVRRGRARTIHQSGGLFPWLTVRENLAAGVPGEATPAARAAKVDEWLELTRLREFGDAYPHQLSGGMRQRVELGRALAGETDALLLDEPFSALDYQSRVRMHQELAATLAARPRTVVLVTHDIDEAVQLGDRVVVLSARPAAVQRTLVVPGVRPRGPAADGVATAVADIRAELGLG